MELPKSRALALGVFVASQALLLEIRAYSVPGEYHVGEMLDWLFKQIPDIPLATNFDSYVAEKVGDGWVRLTDELLAADTDGSITTTARAYFAYVGIPISDADLHKVLSSKSYTLYDQSYKIMVRADGTFAQVPLPKVDPSFPVIDPKTGTVTEPVVAAPVAPLPEPAPVKPAQTVVERPVAPAPESKPDTQTPAELAHLNLSQIAHPSEVSTRPPTPEEIQSFQKNALHMYKFELSEDEARAALESGTLERNGQQYTVWENNKTPEFYLAPSMPTTPRTY